MSTRFQMLPFTLDRHCLSFVSLLLGSTSFPIAATIELVYVYLLLDRANSKQ
jgi:hypothetical protein